MIKTWLLLIGISIVAIIFRFWNLGLTPPSPDWDEASLGYNAYAILTTGKDEYGESLPLTLRSFNDYKPGLYVYFIVPLLILFDLTLVAVRMPSALFGVVTVVATYFLVRKLFDNTNIALLSSLLLAISPWHIQFSRAGFEANIGVAFVVLTALLFLYGLKKPWLLSIAAILAGLSLSLYQSEKVFMPLFALLLVVIYRKKLLTLPKKYLMIAVVCGFITSLPFVTGLVSGQTLSRAQGTSIFQKETADTKKYQLRLAKSSEQGDIVGELLNNRRLLYAKQAVGGYLSHFNTTWLFITGDNPRHHAPNMGLLYIIELPFLLAGIYALLFYKKKDNRFVQAKFFIFGWFLLAPIPAAITIDTPHAVRTLNFLPTFQIFIAFGIISLYSFVKNIQNLWFRRYLSYGVILFVAAAFLFNIMYFLNQYFMQYNYAFSPDWQYGYKEAVSYTLQDLQKYPRVVVSNQVPMDQSYIFFLFYVKYPPKQYQADVKKYEQRGDVRGFDRYVFRPIIWSEEELDEKTLYVVPSTERLPETVQVIKTIHYVNGDPAIYIVVKR